MARLRTQNRRRARRLQHEAWRATDRLTDALKRYRDERYGAEWTRFKHMNLYRARVRRRIAEEG